VVPNGLISLLDYPAAGGFDHDAMLIVMCTSVPSRNRDGGIVDYGPRFSLQQPKSEISGYFAIYPTATSAAATGPKSFFMEVCEAMKTPLVELRRKGELE
jgi:hypothetical protein